MELIKNRDYPISLLLHAISGCLYKYKCTNKLIFLYRIFLSHIENVSCYVTIPLFSNQTGNRNIKQILWVYFIVL